MSSQTMVKQPGKIYILQLLVIIILMFVFQLFGINNSVVYAATTYLFVAIILRIKLLAPHKRGMDYYRKSEYDKAIIEFQRSFDFFWKYSWIDKYRYVTLLSSQVSYIEMALLNMAFCYGQLGNKEMAKQLYIKTLSLFPSCEMAKEALKTIDAIKVKK